MKTDRPLVAAINNDATFLHLLETLLRDDGYETLLLQAGDIAHATLKQHHPKAIVLDIDSDAPGPSWRMVDLLRLDPDTASIPLIVCSVVGQALAGRSPRLVAAGCTIVEKPFTIDELLAHIRANV
jgi:DNA-binding response OmpR family regulator